MVGRSLRNFFAAILGGSMLVGCTPQPALTAEDLTVQVPTGDGQAAPLDNSEWLNAEAPDTTPYGPFDATGINMAGLYSRNSGTAGESGAGSGDDSATPPAPLLVRGIILYSGGVGGMEQQILEGDYPEINKSTAAFTTVGMDESQQPLGLTIPGFAGLSPFAIDVTPIDEMVEYTGTSTGTLVMDYTYRVTPRVWSVDSAGFHGEFDVRVRAAAPNGFEIRGDMTHTVDGEWLGGALSYLATTAYHVDLALDSESLLFTAHQTLRLSGALHRE